NMVAAQFPNHSWYLYDAYKLLMFNLREAYNSKNNEALEQMVRIFRFFNKTEDPLQVIQTQWPSRYGLPYLPEIYKYSMMDLLDHIYDVCDCKHLLAINEPNPAYNILSCKAGCQTFAVISKEIGINTNGNQAPPSPSRALSTVPPSPSRARTLSPSVPRSRRSILQQYDMNDKAGDIAEYQEDRDEFIQTVAQALSKLYEVSTRLSTIIIDQSTMFDYQLLTLIRSNHVSIFNMVNLI